MTLPSDGPRLWPDDARHEWLERAGIMEHDGGLDRAEAERLAERCVRERWARAGTPAGPGGAEGPKAGQGSPSALGRLLGPSRGQQ